MIQMRRFIAMHSSEPGFDSHAAVRDWIAENNPETCDEWRVVEIILDPVTKEIAFGDLARAKEASFLEGIEAERNRMRQLLGLQK